MVRLANSLVERNGFPIHTIRFRPIGKSPLQSERDGEIRCLDAETRLLIQPGYRFRVVDALLTNFHQPRSTLLALVSAFAGRDAVLEAYRAAVELGYRFLSYGDAMWLPRRA